MFLYIMEFPRVSFKSLNCQVHQDMKLNAGLYTTGNSKTTWMVFMRNAQEECAVARYAINLKLVHLHAYWLQ